MTLVPGLDVGLKTSYFFVSTSWTVTQKEEIAPSLSEGQICYSFPLRPFCVFETMSSFAFPHFLDSTCLQGCSRLLWKFFHFILLQMGESSPRAHSLLLSLSLSLPSWQLLLQRSPVTFYQQMWWPFLHLHAAWPFRESHTTGHLLSGFFWKLIFLPLPCSVLICPLLLVVVFVLFPCSPFFSPLPYT